MPTIEQIMIPVGERLGNNVIDVENVSKGFGDRLLIDDLSFKLPRGGIVGVIGPNGAGKSTLFKLLTGQETPDSGKVELGERVHLGYVDQSRDKLDDSKTVWEEISEGAEVIYLDKKEINSRAYCSSFNFKGAGQQAKVGDLSGGQRNRVHLAKVLKSGANVLLLDERLTTLTPKPLLRWKTLWRAMQVVPWLSRTIVCSSTVWQRTCWPLKVTPTLSGLKVTSKTTRKIRFVVWAHTLLTHAASSTSHLPAKYCFL